MDYKKYIKTYPDFPQKGILFKDISPLLNSPKVFQNLITDLDKLTNKYDYENIVVVDARGFIFGSALALYQEKGITMCRKKGKLPGNVASKSYDYEYSSAELEIQINKEKNKKNVLILDDVIATGNTLLTIIDLLNQANYNPVAIACFLELSDLNGRELLSAKNSNIPLLSILKI